MITLRRAHEREHLRRPRANAWLTFSPQDRETLRLPNFDHLRLFEEGRLAPRNSSRQPVFEEADIITYVREGTVDYEDSTGRVGLISAGEFQRMTAGRGIRYAATNTSSTSWAHVFQLWLRPSVEGLEPGHEQKRFTAAQRRGALCMIASPDGRRGSLRIHQDATLFSAILERGQHVVHELSNARCAWLHIVQGAALCGTETMVTGDGAGIEAQPAVSLTASEQTEVLLLDLACAGATDERVLV